MDNTFKDSIIDRGIKSCKKDKNFSPYEIEGSIEGFELCRNMSTPSEFIDVIQKRYEEEVRMITSNLDEKEIEKYWKFHYTTIQIEFVYNKMIFMWQLIGTQASIVSV